MNIYWCLFAMCLLVGFHYAMRFGAKAVERHSGRESSPEKSSTGYDAVFFGLAFAIGIPPIYLLPDVHPFVQSAFSLVGIVIGSLTSQAMFGKRKHA